MGTPQKFACMMFLVIMAAFMIITYVHDVTKMACLNEFGDFGNYYFYAKAINLKYPIYTLDDATIERLRIQFGMPPFVHPTLHSPSYLFLISFIAFFKYRPAITLWLLLNSAALLITLLLIVGMICEERKDIEKWFLLLTSVFLVFAFQPLLENMAVGQVNVLILFFFVMCLYLLKRGRPLLAGLLLSVGVVIKVHFGILLLFFLWKKEYRVFLSAGVTLIILELLGGALYGAALERDYLFAGTPLFTYYTARDTSSGNICVPSLMGRVFNQPFFTNHPLVIPVAVFIISLFFMVYAFSIARGRTKGMDMKFMLEFSLIILALFIVFPHVMEHHFVILYLPIVVIWALLIEHFDPFAPPLRRGSGSTPSKPWSLGGGRRGADPRAVIAFLISFLLIGLKYAWGRFPTLGGGLISLVTGLKLYGVIILFFLVAAMIRGCAPGAERR